MLKAKVTARQRSELSIARESRVLREVEECIEGTPDEYRQCKIEESDVPSLFEGKIPYLICDALTDAGYLVRLTQDDNLEVLW